MQFKQVFVILSALSTTAFAAPAAELVDRETVSKTVTIQVGPACNALDAALTKVYHQVEDTVCYALSNLASVQVSIKGNTILTFTTPGCTPGPGSSVVSGACNLVKDLGVSVTITA